MSKSTAKELVAFRLPPELRKKLDKIAAEMSARSPGLEVNRSEVARILMLEALAAREAADGKE